MRYGFKEVVIDSRTGLNPRKNFVLGNGENNYITIKDIYNGQINITDKTDKVDDDAIQIIKKRSRIKVGDILFVSIGRIGETAIVKTKDDTWDVNESVFVFTINREIITPEYFCMLFQSDAVQRYLAGNSSGSTFKSIKMNRLEKMIFDIPPLKDQEEITTKLSKVKALCNLRASELAQLDCLIKARFVEIFGDLADPASKWEKCKLVEACVNSDDIKCGPFGTQLGKDEYTEKGVAVWEIPQINAEFKTIPTHYVTDKKAVELDAYSIIPGDIAMSRKGNVGRCAVFPATFENGIIHSDVLRIRLDKTKALPEFMMRQLHYSGDIQHQIELVSSGAIMAGINVTKLKQILVCLPPLDLQGEFVSFVTQVDKSKVAVQKALDETQLLFESLMQNYFG